MATREQLLAALRNAHNAGDTSGAHRIGQMIAAMDAQPKAERSFKDVLYENLVGVGEADTFGEKAGQYVRGLAAATARGIADAPALPANLLQLGAKGVEKLFGMQEPSMVSRGLEALPDTRAALYSLPIIGEEARYVAPDRAGRWISTAGEAIGGGGMMAGPKALLPSALSGLGSEGGAEVSQRLFPDNPNAEIIGRLVGAVAAPSVASRIASPAGAPSAARTRNVNTLREAGLPVTAGQTSGSRTLRTLEGSSEISDDALRAFNSYVMRQIGGSADDLAGDPAALEAIKNGLKGEFDDITSNLRVDPTLTPVVSQLDDIAKTYAIEAPSGELRKVIEHVSDQLGEALSGGQQLTSTAVMRWRSQLSEMTRSGDAATVSAAVKAIDAVDGMVEASLIAAGRAQDVARLAAVRPAWRDFLAVETAATRATNANDLITPASLRNALAAQNRTQLLYGDRGDLGAVTKAAADVYRSAPTVLPDGLRKLAGFVPAATAAASVAATGSPALGALGWMAPYIGRGVLNTPPVQSALKVSNPAAFEALQGLSLTQRLLLGAGGGR